MGRIVASAAHELNNVMAIAEQNAGLLQDLLAQGVSPPPEKLAQIAEGILVQSRRGVDLLRAVRAFAHSADADRVDFDVTATLANLCLLARRRADVKGVRLTLEPSPERVTLWSSPFRFQQVVYLVIESCLESAGEADTFSIRAQRQDGHVVVRIDAGVSAPPAPEVRAQIEALMRGMRGELRWPARGARANIELEFGA
jgi:signal transduction histidine kinase